MRLSPKLTFISLITLALLLAGCLNVPLTRTGATETMRHTVDRGGAEQVNVTLSPAVGEFRVRGGATELMEGEFTYNLDQLRPTINYSVRNGVGTLEVAPRDASINLRPLTQVTSRWDLQLNGEIPLDLAFVLGFGDSDLDLREVNLSELEIQSGAGRVHVQVGEQEMERVRVRAGLGDTNLDLGGGRVQQLRFEAGAGTVNIDLDGRWQADLDAQISGGLGNITLVVPEQVGVRVVVNRGLGSVNARGFTVDDNVYTNGAYGNSEVTLRIEVNQGAGSVNIRGGE
jgi:hypothetical protein